MDTILLNNRVFFPVHLWLPHYAVKWCNFISRFPIEEHKPILMKKRKYFYNKVETFMQFSFEPIKFFLMYNLWCHVPINNLSMVSSVNIFQRLSHWGSSFSLWPHHMPLLHYNLHLGKVSRTDHAVSHHQHLYSHYNFYLESLQHSLIYLTPTAHSKQNLRFTPQ